MKRIGKIASRLRRYLRGCNKKTGHRNERLRILSACLARLLSERTAEKIVADIFPEVARHVGADAFFNYLAISEGQHFDLLAYRDISEEAVCSICDACSGGALHCLAAKTRSIVSANNIQHSDDPKFSRIRSIGVQTYLCIPLLVDERLLGILSFASRTKTAFTSDEIDFLQLITGHVAIAIDRARSEELLREREQRLQLAMEAAKMGTWELKVDGNINTPLQDQEVIDAFNTGRPSPQVEEMMGLKPGEYHSYQDWESRLHPDDRAYTLDAFRSAIRGDRPYDVEHRFVWSDGSVHWVHCRGMMFRDRADTFQRFMGVSIDITARKQAEEDIRQRNERLQFISTCLAQLLAERDPDHIVAKLFSQVAIHVGADACLNFRVDDDKPDEIVLHVSLGVPNEIQQRIQRLRFGEGPCGMVAQTRSIIVGKDIQHSTDSTFDLIRGWGFQCFAGYPLVAGDRLMGTLDFAATAKAEFTLEEREFLNVIAKYVAIAIERARAERAILQSKEEAEKANRAKDLFIATLSHELRNPLTQALMTATALEQDDTMAPYLREQMHVVQRGVEMEARLIDDLLDVTRIEQGKFSLRPAQVDIPELIDRAMEIVREDALIKQLTLTTDVVADKTSTQGDPARLQQVFWNLLINAIKFTPSGGSIHIQVFNPEPHILCFEVKDSGIGINQASLKIIFDPFEQCVTAGDHRYGGLGLGLAISRSIVELHGGTIRAASEGTNKGATFTVCLPIIETATITPSKPESIHQKPHPAHLRILLVEDHEHTRMALDRVLTRDGHEVETAGTCAEALEVAHASSATSPFNLLISDIGLPDGSGLNLVRQLKAETPELTAIALSGYGTHADVERSIQAGFNTHLTKPIGIEDLRRALAA